MTRPIVWALGSFAALAVGATLAGDRLAKLGREADGRAPAAAVPAPSPAGLPGGTLSFGRTVSLAGDGSGHFAVEAAVEGRHVTMLVDTGASIVALRHEDAAAAGIRPFPSDYSVRIGTANGEVGAARVRLRQVRVGEIEIRDVDAVVMPPGRLGTSLLGMSFLRQLRSFDVSGNRLTLRG